MSNGEVTIKYLQDYIKSKDHDPKGKERYFIKLSEEVGELARAMLKNLRPTETNQIKETIEEELWDVMYYVLVLANCYDIDLEKVIPVKEKLNNIKYANNVEFKPSMQSNKN